MGPVLIIPIVGVLGLSVYGLGFRCLGCRVCLEFWVIVVLLLGGSGLGFWEPSFRVVTAALQSLMDW